MATVTSTTELPAAPEAVWAKLADPTSYKEWLTTHAGLAEGGDGPLSAGDTFKERVTIMGMPGEVDWTVLEVVEHERLVLDGKGPMGTTMRAAYQLKAGGDGTVLDYEVAFDGAVLATMEGPLTAESQKSAGESMDKLRALLA